MDFTKISDSDMDSVVTKFRNAGAKVRLSNSPAAQLISYEEMALMTDVVGINQLRAALINQGKVVMLVPNDPILGSSPGYAFSIEDSAGRTIKFTQEDIYLVIRHAYKTRKESNAYKNKLATARRLKQYLEDNKSTKEKLKDAQKQLKELGIDDSEI